MRPPTKRVDYKVGDKVEVCSKEDGLVGKYTVRYKNLLKDDESELLTEILFLKDLCLVPPRVRRPSKFKLNQKVYVFDNDGWWIGEITSDKILMQKTYYYNVTIFPTPIKPLTTRVIKLGFMGRVDHGSLSHIYRHRHHDL
ncbi:hypothetical protein MTR_2g011700 [Medicago truncatula]|uniref:Agenet-like domain-containing protein n=1 Tax=Medicago truncatula TaxID=3880 RepID=A0A072V587_MEDTR|nr:hypothetical protein MTR_2g011700 [Medicago truncatula]